jgi:hypothetical protein
MRTALSLLAITAAVILGSAHSGSAAPPHRVHQAAPARTAHATPVQGAWCLYYHAGGANCRFGDFQGCMYAAAAAGGNCQLSPSWRARYGEQFPPLDRWIYSGNPDRCLGVDDARCY